MTAHQCPRCDLRFVTDNEVRGHLVDDHKLDPEVIERHLPGWTPDLLEHREDPDLVHPRRRRASSSTSSSGEPVE